MKKHERSTNDELRDFQRAVLDAARLDVDDDLKRTFERLQTLEREGRLDQRGGNASAVAAVAAVVVAAVLIAATYIPTVVAVRHVRAGLRARTSSPELIVTERSGAEGIVAWLRKITAQFVPPNAWLAPGPSSTAWLTALGVAFALAAARAEQEQRWRGVRVKPDGQ